MEISPEIQRAQSNEIFVCFRSSHRIAEGSLSEVAVCAWHSLQAAPTAPTLTFNRLTGKVVDLNLSGSERDVADRYAVVADTTPKRGRPKLGVVAREITLLPRHWDWLAQQPGGASVALRRLVEAARKDHTTSDDIRERITAAYSFVAAIAGDLPLFEEASRALFAQNFAKLHELIAEWPSDIRGELSNILQSRIEG